MNLFHPLSVADWKLPCYHIDLAAACILQFYFITNIRLRYPRNKIP